MSWYLQVLKKYAVFEGRARRKEYWFFVLFNAIFTIGTIILDNVIGTAIENLGYGLFYIVYSLAMILPSIAVSVRRLHDTSRSGWWLFIALVPLIGGIILLVFMVQDSHEGENEYGPNPKAA